ncbi:hypothetical protein [Saccharibacillus sacchari]|uniref:Uncharacterized protein n=1 Tax=Saccharibacillus sacchari TaxID=456493 RepID=A0ACC6PB44_9BACL
MGGCLKSIFVFIVSLFASYFFYMSLGSIIIDYMSQLFRGEKVEVMAYAFQWAPLLSLMTALIPTVLVLRKQYADRAEALKQKSEEEHSAE